MAIVTAEDFYQAVRVMREAQKYYFETKSPMALNTAKRREDEVDRFIKSRERRLADRKQGKLIGGA
ncbi:MAG: hypothetical protein LBS37_04225 [Treponema sp.]|jgi:hypothetical protein|nr:hypothetical protein [Treponema sp.]